MQSSYSCLFALAIAIAATTAAVYKPTLAGSPIEEVHTSIGQGNHERVIYIRAIIWPTHINTAGRNNFPRTNALNEYFTQARAAGDERGHLVGSQFSGPGVWYNLSPQNARVNRNAGYRSITTDWYNTECDVRSFLDQNGDRHVEWEVYMTYIGDSNRPDSYHLLVNYYEGGRHITRYSIDSTIHNPFLREDSTFWVCRECPSRRPRRDINNIAQCEKEAPKPTVLKKIANGLLFVAALGLLGEIK